MNPKKYYPHVDGIRFFAVLLVILFHFNKELFPYGYLGVDIFFVISGFVITKLIYSELEVKKFNLINLQGEELITLDKIISISKL